MPVFTAPPFGVFTLDLRKEISEYEEIYKTATGSKKYLYGKLLAENRGYLVALEAGSHFPVRFGKVHAVCLCGITIPSTHRGEKLPEFLHTKGHRDINGEPTSQFYYLEYLAPQHYHVQLVCQDCHVVEKQNIGHPDGKPKHDCERLIAQINYEI